MTVGLAERLEGRGAVELRNSRVSAWPWWEDREGLKLRVLEAVGVDGLSTGLGMGLCAGGWTMLIGRVVLQEFGVVVWRGTSGWRFRD